MLKVSNITKSFDNKIIFKDFNLTVEKSEFLAIVGESGRGKTTLLNIIGLLEKPDCGNITIENETNPSNKRLMELRREKIGYLFQNFALIENLTVEKNLLISLEYNRSKHKKSLMKEALRFVNLNNDYLDKKIYQLSGGEQQRVAIARLYLKNCDYIFADEPTGNLDEKNKKIIYDLLKKMNDSGKTIIVVTHDSNLTLLADRVITL